MIVNEIFRKGDKNLSKIMRKVIFAYCFIGYFDEILNVFDILPKSEELYIDGFMLTYIANV